jgi:hypothetical protein
VVTPTLVMNNITVAKDTLNVGGVGLAQGIKPPSTNLAVTVTSADPSRILLSPDATTPPTASITIAIPPNTTGVNFYIHALSDNGNVAITATAAGFSNVSSTIQLVPLVFGFMNYQTPPINALIQAGPQTLQVGASLPPFDEFNPFPLTLRPGVPPITIGVSSSSPSTVSVSPKQLVFQGTLSNASVTYTPLKPGTANLNLSVPSGFAYAGPLAILAAAGTISPGSLTLQLGGNLEAAVNFSPSVAQANMTVTVTSSDPSKVVVSTDSSTPGASAVTLTNAGAGFQPVYAQALVDSGNVTLHFSSPGYPTASLPVTIVPVGAVFASVANYEQTLFTNAGVQQLPITLTPLDPVALQPLPQAGPAQTVRPGASLSVAVTSSDPTVIAITTPTVQFSAQPPANGSTGQTAGIQPVASGTAIVTLAALPGNPTPASQNQIVFTVAEPELSIPALTLGRDLQAPVQIKLGSTVSMPTTDVAISVNANYGVQLGANPGDTGQSSLSVTIPAGQRMSNPFYVQGLYAGSGQLNYGGGSFPNFSTTVTVTQTAFVIQEAANGQALDLAVGANSNLTIVPALSPPFNGVPGPLSIRGGASPILIAVTPADPSVAASSPAQVTFNPGDQQQTVSVQGLSSGTTTIKLLGTNYDFSQPQASIQVVVK